MSFFNQLKKIFGITSSDYDIKKKKQANDNIKRDQNPLEKWDIVGELGDGAFGKVYKVGASFSQDSNTTLAVQT